MYLTICNLGERSLGNDRGFGVIDIIATLVDYEAERGYRWVDWYHATVVVDSSNHSTIQSFIHSQALSNAVMWVRLLCFTSSRRVRCMSMS